MGKELKTFEDMLAIWKEDPETAGTFLTLSPDMKLPYTSQELLLTRLRFQFYTLTAMQRGMLNAV